MSNLLMASTALAVGLSLGAASYAQPPASDPPRQTVVKDGDLNLANTAGVEALKHRVDVAARQVCGPEPDIRILGDSKAYRLCVAHAETQAVSAYAQVATPTRLAQAR